MGWRHPFLKAGITAVFLFSIAPAWAGSTVLDKIRAEPSLKTFANAVKASGLSERLSGAGPFTVFAPNNEAFDGLPEGELTELLQPAHQADLRKLVSRHVVAMRITVDPATETDRDLTALSGDAMTLSVNSDFQAIDTAHIVGRAITADNGVTYVVDEVILAEPTDGEEEDE